MLSVHKISVDFYEDSFGLIAMHSSLEDYAMAYALNLHLKSNFRRCRKDLDISEEVTIPIFEWNDDANGGYWTFFANNGVKEDTLERDGFFKDEPSFTPFHMVPEYREVDYFLKIEQDDFVVSPDLVKKILAIPKVITAYNVQYHKLKSKKNLIF